MGAAERISAILSIIILSLVTGSSFALGNVDPHDDTPENCQYCHTQVPTSEDASSGELFLIEDTIDGTCHTCHPYDCCRINSLKGHNHPSNVSEWDVENFTEPTTLPLHDGFITCNTCHFHLRPDGQDYRMVRIVKIKLEGVDWVGLCLDCHRNY